MFMGKSRVWLGPYNIKVRSKGMDLQPATSTLTLHKLNIQLQNSNTDLKTEVINSAGFTPPLETMSTVFLNKFQIFVLNRCNEIMTYTEANCSV